MMKYFFRFSTFSSTGASSLTSSTTALALTESTSILVYSSRGFCTTSCTGPSSMILESWRMATRSQKADTRDMLLAMKRTVILRVRCRSFSSFRTLA